MYDIEIFSKKQSHISFSIGLAGGTEIYRTKNTEITYIGCGNSFVGSCSQTSKFFYEQQHYFASIVSIKFQYAPYKAYIGSSIEPFIIVNNHSRVTFGLALNVLLGKIN